MIRFILVTLLLLLSFPPKVFAATIPQPSKPENNAITSDTSPELSWDYSANCPSSGNCYLIEIAKTENFQPTEKSTYTNNKTYSPTLSEGKFYWHLKAKDESGNWSEFSETKSFEISSNVPSPSPTPNPNVIATTKPSPSPSPQNQGTTEKEKQSFTISVANTTFASTEIITITVTLSHFTSDTTYYIKPSFYQEGSTNYFGLSEINGSWIKNSQTATSQYKITTDSSGNWNGTLSTKVDSEDSGFKGSGNYHLKVGRYSESGSGPSWSNNLPISVTHSEPIDQQDNPNPDPIPPAEILGEQTELLEQPDDDYTLSKTKVATSSASPITYQLATISAQQNIPQPKQPLIKNSIHLNWWFISSGFLLLALSSVYVVYQRKKMYHA